jgi:hypothetical protein
MPERPDLLTQLERYGTVLDAQAAEQVIAPRPTIRSAEHGRAWRRSLLSMAAAVLLLIGAVALFVRGEDVSSGPNGNDVPTVEESPTPATSPRVVAGRLPGGLVAVAVLEAGGSVVGANSSLQTGAQATVQAFSLRADGEAPVTVHVVSEGTDDPEMASSAGGPVRGVGGSATGSVVGVHGLNWYPARGAIYAQAPTALSRDDLRAFVEALRSRSEDPIAGFDAPTGPTGRWTASLQAERVVARGTPSPAVSRVWYADPAAPGRTAIVEGYAPVPGTETALLGARQAIERRTIAGAERVVASAGPGGTEMMVTWLGPDGTQMVVHTNGLDDNELATLVGGVQAANETTWAQVGVQADDAVRSTAVAASADLPIGRVTLYRDTHWADDPDGPARLRGACLTVPSGASRCAVARPAHIISTIVVLGAGGFRTPDPSGTIPYVVGVTVEGRWYALGGVRRLRDVKVRAGGVPVEVDLHEAPDGLTLFGVEIPVGADRAEVRVEGQPDPRIPGNGEPLPITVSLVRP